MKSLAVAVAVFAIVGSSSVGFGYSVPSGYSASVYASGLPATTNVITAMAVDPASGALFYAEADGNTTSRVFRVDTNHNATLLGTPTANVNGFAFAASDIQYFGGQVYAHGFRGIASISSTGGVPNQWSSTAVDVVESGLAVVGNTLYYTSGNNVMPGALHTIDLTTNATSSVAALPGNASSLEYSAATGKLYFSTGPSSGTPSFYSFNLVNNTPTFIATLPGGNGNDFGNFAVDPTGTNLYVREGTTLTQINLTTGTASTFMTGLADASGFADLVFGPPTNNTASLFIADGTTIVEVSGFVAPEPTTLALAALAVPILRRRRQR